MASKIQLQGWKQTIIPQQIFLI